MRVEINWVVEGEEGKLEHRERNKIWGEFFYVDTRLIELIGCFVDNCFVNGCFEGVVGILRMG